MAVLLTKSEDLWNPYKDLKTIVWKHLNEDCDDTSTTELENTLRKHKQNFFSLLKNPPKNAKSREELKNAMVDGITVKGIGHQILSKELYQEAIILSDMFNINEFVALDLLCTAQIQMPYYPNLPRGLVAILLYYDGRKALVTSLLYLVQARSGIQWCVKVKPDLERYITDYTNQLMEGGLFNRIFHLLRKLDLSTELEKLQGNLALGGAKHRRQVTDLFNDIRHILADIVFSWAAQSGLPQEPSLSLINYLREVKLDEEASGKLDDVNLYLLMALMCSLDLSVLHSREDGEEAVQLLPILSNPNYIQAVINEFLPEKPKWVSDDLQAFATFGLAVCLASLRVVPQNHQFQEAINKEEMFVDQAIEMNVFAFMNNILLESPMLFKETYIYKRMHNLLTDFIVYMYPKVKELRLKADEMSRTMQLYQREGLDAPGNLPKYFEHLLLAVGKFYMKDELSTGYMLSYWSPIDINPAQNYSYRAPPRAVSLFKFIRIACDMLPTSLFVPFLSMLSGLSSSPQTARHCFNMLKQVGSHLSPTLSWDHFFMSFAQYYSNLRQEAPPIADTIYRNRAAASYHKGVSPQELDGLHAVLKLIRTVAEQDEFSRLALCQHPGWSPLTVFLGLVSCSVPIPLKAELLETLAALAGSAENATQLWENLEASQILVTIPTTSSYAPRGIQTELDEIESRMEEFPLTRALLKLLDVLTSFGVPRTLGAGPRQPGFDPYLSFIVNSVFLKFHARSYRNPTEKWEVARLCLKLFEKFLLQYDPNPTDFAQNEFNSPPGFHLMLQLNNKSEVLNVILDIVDEGNRLFDGYVPFQGQEAVKDCTLAALKIIQRALVLQGKFFNLLAASGSSVVLTSILKLLLTINRRSGKPDHCVNIAKYLSYQAGMPEHSHVAVRILNHITSSPPAHNQFMNILISSDETRTIIKNGVVECLDSQGEDSPDMIVRTKIEILKLLKQCLPYHAPNLSHYFLGFDLRRDITKTEFQFPGVLDFPRSGLHSLISILDASVSKFMETPPARLLELAYHVLYLLASNGKTSGPVLRFVRLNKMFFRDHLRQAKGNLQGASGLNQLNQLAWLMKTTAIELKIACDSKQVSYLKQLTSFLVNVPLDESNNQNMFSVFGQSRLTDNVTLSADDIKAETYMSSLIGNFELKLPVVEAPVWEFFDSNALQTILKNCQTKTKIIDLKKLHQVLYDELKTLQGTTVMGQIQVINQEIPKLMKYALELNTRNETAASVIEFVDAWRQVAEILVVYPPQEILSHREQQAISISLALHLLRSLVRKPLLSEVARLSSGALLLIMDSVRNCYQREQKMQWLCKDIDPDHADVLELYQSSLKEILEHLVEWVIVSDVVDSELRVNLYASLVTFLQMSNIELPKDNVVANSSLYVSRLDSSRTKLESRDKRLQFTSDIISKFGDKALLEILCHDCIGGQEICKILAMAAFSHLSTVAGNLMWIQHMSSRGYLRHIIQSILESDGELKETLEPSTASLKPLYLYLGKMLLLARVGETRVGAEILLEHRLFPCFSHLSVLGFHPEISKTYSGVSEEALSDFLPAIDQKYLQLWMPTLDICNAVLTSLGTENQSAVVQIMYFILSHLDVIELVLRSAHPELSPMSLKELALVTFVLARTANNNLVNVLENQNIVQNHRAQLYRLQKLMLGVLPKFILSEETLKSLLSADPGSTECSQRLIYGMQIMCNLLSYARNIVANHGIDHAGVGVLFYPSLSNPLLPSKAPSGNEQEPSLGIIVQQLISAVAYQHQEKVTYDLLSRKLRDIPNMNSGELRPFISDELELCDVILKREKAFEALTERFEQKKKEMEYCAFIIENSLYLIWLHLDFYMLRAIPKPKIFPTIQSNASLDSNTTLASASEATWKVSTDVISALKQGLVSLFNDSFSKQLLETAQGRSEADKEFVDALLRKIKRLVQFVPVK